MNQIRKMATVGKPKIRIHKGEEYRTVSRIVHDGQLHTVCEEARCPNVYECWNRRTATIMILGDTCTRSCGFCAVKTGKPANPDPMEPYGTAMAVKKMGLRHVVITSVDRDDLKPDFGVTHWAQTLEQIRRVNPDCTVEVLTPDFQGYVPALETVFKTVPDIFGHNVECVERISRRVRNQAKWQRSMDVLEMAVDFGLLTKTGMMVGLGETFDEVVETMKQVVNLGVEIITLGQYLQPTATHLPVHRYVEWEEFRGFETLGLEMGFKVVKSGPLVRSSYQADEQARMLFTERG